MPTYTALMRIKSPAAARRCRAVTLTELIVVLAIVSLFVIFPAMNICGLFTKSTFKAQAHELVSTLQMAASAAAESDRRYEVIIDLTEQTYLLREITSTDLSVIFEDDIIAENDLGSNCQAAYVEFDDLEYTNDGRAKFRAGRSGWEYGGKIVLLDSDGRAYSVVINRISRIVELRNGEVGLLRPRSEDEMLF